MDENNEIKVEVVTGPWKSDPKKTWTGVKVSVGTWSSLVFPKTSFEMDYIKQVIAENEA